MPHWGKIIAAVLIFGGLITIMWEAPHPFELYRERPLPVLNLREPATGEAFTTQRWITQAKGRPLAINIFASWCGPCHQEMPELHKLGKIIPLYGVAVQDSPAAISAMLEKEGNPFRDIGLDNSGELAIILRVDGLPTTLILDGQGQIYQVKLGPFGTGEVENKYRNLLKHLY